MKEARAGAIQAAARGIMPCMHASTISMQQGHIGSTGKTPVGGTAFLCGGELSKYRSSEIKDNRGWGRFSGRVIQGQKRSTVNNKRQRHRTDPHHHKITNVAIICVYAAVEGTLKSSMWQTQIRKINALPRSERQYKTSTKGSFAVKLPWCET